MATLSGRRPSDTYGDLIRLENSGVGITASNLVLEDGHGTATALAISTAGGEFSGTWTLAMGATLEATYADIAERVAVDNEVEQGDVLSWGGESEATRSIIEQDINIAGVVSTNPAYKMNSAAGTDQTHPYLALAGRVPVKVVGEVTKGDLIVSSHLPGIAVATSEYTPGSVIGRALETSANTDIKLLEVFIQRM